jgi:4-hydroxyphenylpyruvate dioxygenase
MNVIVNAHGQPAGSDETPQIAAVALRVRDAGAAWQRLVDLGAWPVPVEVQPMELHIPGVHGVGSSRIFFVDRWREFSIYDVDFVPIPTVEPEVPALAGLHWFGIVQYIGYDRSEDWCAFYERLFGFVRLPEEQRFGILPAGRVLASPCGTFFLQLIEPPPDAESDLDEHFQRVAFGAPDVPAATRALHARGVEFVDNAALHADARGALTRPLLGGVMFELVRHQAAAQAAGQAL